MDIRKIEENFFRGLMVLVTMMIILILFFILAVVIIKGLPAMNWAMISQAPKGGFYLGKEGGILNAILGSLYLVSGALVLAIFISLPVVLYLNVFAPRNSRFADIIRFCIDVLWGIPSIVYGAFGFAIMIFCGLRASLLGGIITVALLIFPILSRTVDEVMRMIPHELLEASYALGATRWETALKVVLRQAFPGILTAVLIALGRGIGDAASVLFTAGFTDALPGSLFRPAATLPLAIFFQLGTPVFEVQQRAYASAFILTLIILIISITSRFLTRRLTKYILK